MKTLEQLKNILSTSVCTHGHFKVTLLFRGGLHTITSNNTLAYDMLNEEDVHRNNVYTTAKQAYVALYNEVKVKCDLN